MNIKKIISVALCTTMLASLVACSPKDFFSKLLTGVRVSTLGCAVYQDALAGQLDAAGSAVITIASGSSTAFFCVS